MIGWGYTHDAPPPGDYNRKRSDHTSMAYPADYRYTKEHEWIHIAGQQGTVGITDYAQNSLGDIVFVELPRVGDTVQAHKIFGSVESVKAVSDLFAPMSGTVTAINQDLATAPEKINTEANTTWIMKLDLSSPAEADTLLSATDYETFTSEETGH